MSTSAPSLASAERACVGLEGRTCSTAIPPTLPAFISLCGDCGDEAVRRRLEVQERGVRQRAMLANGFAPAFIEGRKSLETVRVISTGHQVALRVANSIAAWKKPDGCRRGFVLRGGPGIGKSLIAEAAGVAFCNAIGGEAAAAVFFNARQLGIDLQAASAPNANTTVESLVKKCSTARLLVLDDLGATRLTRFQLDGIYLVFDNRNRHELPTITTTNYLTMADLAARLVPSDGGDLQDAQRVVDRLEELCPIVITLHGESQRSKVNREPLKEEGRS